MDAVVVESGISSLHQNQVTLFHSGSGRGASNLSGLVLSSEPSLLMAMLQVFADVPHLTKVFALVGGEVRYSFHALVVGAW